MKHLNQYKITIEILGLGVYTMEVHARNHAQVLAVAKSEISPQDRVVSVHKRKSDGGDYEKVPL